VSDGSRGVQQPNKDEAGKVIIVVIGVGLVLVGLTLLGRQLFWPFLSFDRVWGIIRGAGFGLGLIIVGIITIIWTQRRGFKMPAKGARLHRSRTDRVVAGVLGGVAAFLEADPTLVHEHDVEGWTRHGLGNTQSLCDALHELRLASPQVPRQKYDVARPRQGADGFAHVARALGGVGLYDESEQVDPPHWHVARRD